MKKCTILLLLMVSLMLVSCKGQNTDSKDAKCKEVTIKVDSSMQVNPEALKFSSFKLLEIEKNFTKRVDLQSIFRDINSSDDFIKLLEEKNRSNKKIINPFLDQNKIIFEPYCESIEVKTIERKEKPEVALNEEKLVDDSAVENLEFPKTLYSKFEFFVCGSPCEEDVTEFLIYKAAPITMSGICDDKWYEINFKGRKFYALVENFSEVDEITEGREFKVSKTYSYLFDDGLGGKYLSFAENVFDEIQMEAKNILKEEDWKVYLTNRDLSKLFDYYDTHICAYTLFDRKEIWISKSACNKSMITHEIGHLIDGENSVFSNDKDFLYAFDLEMKNISIFDKTSSSNYNTPDEYFAECYSMFMTKRYDLSKYCPYTYEYMKSLFEQSDIA